MIGTKDYPSRISIRPRSHSAGKSMELKDTETGKHITCLIDELHVLKWAEKRGYGIKYDPRPGNSDRIVGLEKLNPHLYHRVSKNKLDKVIQHGLPAHSDFSSSLKAIQRGNDPILRVARTEFEGGGVIGSEMGSNRQSVKEIPPHGIEVQHKGQWTSLIHLNESQGEGHRVKAGTRKRSR